MCYRRLVWTYLSIFIGPRCPLVSFPNPLALESGLVERTHKNGPIWLGETLKPNFVKNCIKPLTLGTSLASDTQKQPVSTGETSFCWILEPQLPFFYQPPIWDKINLRFGTGFISISLDFHSCLLISMGQNAVPIWPFLGVRSPASLSEWGGEPVYTTLIKIMFFRHVQTAAALGDVARLMDWVLARMT